MNELFDKLILRVFFTLFICGILYIYQFCHSFFYPSSRRAILKRFNPETNSPDTIHFFSKIIGIGIIFSEFYLDLSDGLLYSLVDFFLKSAFVFSLYITSIYIMESITLYNYEYKDEILKKKNWGHALISLTHSLTVAIVLKEILLIVHNSIVMIFFLWLFTIVLLGLSIKLFPLISKLPLNKLLHQKNISVSLSYLGHIWGCAIIITSAIHQPLNDVKWFSIQVILKILLALIIIPIFKFVLTKIFKIVDQSSSQEISISPTDSPVTQYLGRGVYEGSMTFTCCYLATVISGQISLSSFYPIS